MTSNLNYQLKLLKIPVKNVDVSSQFYADNLGLNIDFAAAEYGWAQLSSGDFSMALYVPGMGGGDGQIGGSVDFHLSLPAAEFDKLANDLLKKGHLNEGMIHSGNDGSTFVDMLDPDGNVLKIMKR
ncbi:MAG: VOC family protein [Chloroflexota bacterium]